MLLKNISRVWVQFSKKRKIKILFLLILILLCSVMEAISISSVLIYLSVLADPSKLFYNQHVHKFIEYLKIGSPNELILPFTILFIILIFISVIARLVLLVFQTKIGYAITTTFSANMYIRTLYQSYVSLMTRNSSEIISGIEKSVNILNGLMNPLMNMISGGLNILAIIVTLMIINFYVAISAIIWFGLVYFLVVIIVKKKLRKNSFILNNESNKKLKALQEGLGGIRDILIDGTQAIYGRIYESAHYHSNNANASIQVISQIPRLVMEFVGIFFICTISFFLVIRGGGINSALPILGSLALAAQRLLPAIQIFYFNWATIIANNDSVNDGLNYLEQKLPDYALNQKPDPITFKKHIKLENVSFYYNSKGSEVLSNCNLILEKGKKYGFIGTTGCGKSTLLDIIMALLTPTGGNLLIDDTIINDENYRAWQGMIAHVPQAIYLSDASIAENIAFGIEKDKIDLFRVKEAAKKAQIDTTIEIFPDNYNTLVGERGVRLSGGQRQRIGIARALYKNAKVIIFDEATSALDNETELAVMKSIEILSNDLTILIVAHRLSTLKNCDKIFRITNGVLVESTTFTNSNHS